MKKRICMVVHQDYFTDARVRTYAGTLTRNGWDVDVLAVRGEGQSFHETAGEVDVFSLPLGRGYGSLPRYLLEYGMAVSGFSLLLGARWFKRRYDVVHVHNMPDFLVFSALLPRLFGSRILLDVHDPMPEFYSSKYQSSLDSLPVKAFRLQERLSAGFAHGVIAANETFRDNLVARGVPESKVIVVNNVPDPAVFQRPAEKPPRGGFTLLYPGTIAPRYGLAVAVRALPRLVKEIPDVRLRIVGPEVEHSRELQRLGDELGVSAALSVEPRVPGAEVPRLMCEADVGVYPAIPDPHMSIATPTKVLEFAAMGLPVVASRLPVLDRLFGQDTVAYFEPGDADGLAERVIELWRSERERAALVSRMDEVFDERFSLDHEQGQYLDLLDRVTSR